MSIAFELAGEADGEVLVRLARAFHLEDGHPLDNPGEAALLQITRGEPFAQSWIVREDGRPIGYLILTLGCSVEYGGPGRFFYVLYLVPAARRSAVGGELLPFALRAAPPVRTSGPP